MGIEDVSTGEYDPRSTKSSEVDENTFGDNRHMDHNLSPSSTADELLKNGPLRMPLKKMASVQEKWRAMAKRSRKLSRIVL